MRIILQILKSTHSVFLMFIVFLLVSGGCNILSDTSCRELVSGYESEVIELQRYTTKITIEFNEEMTHQQGEDYLDKLGLTFYGIWASAFVVETGCGNPANRYYTNYGTNEVLSLGDSSFVKYVHPVFYNRKMDSDYYLRDKVGIQFNRELEFERIEAIARSLNLEFRDFDPGAQFNRYWLIVRKLACCNPIGMTEILKNYEEVEITEPSWNFTIPNPNNSTDFMQENSAKQGR